MRYFKCDTLKQEDRKMITQYISLTEAEKKCDRQGDFLNVAATVLFVIAFITVLVISLFAIVHIPDPQNPFLRILVVVAMFVLGFGALIVSLFAGALISSPIYKKAQKKLIVRKKICFDKALISLREYYGWQDPCIVTKCYDSSDRKFKKRDVCIFVVDDELRLAADLKHGFSIRENDLGCYAFGVDEFTIAQIQSESFLITELKSEDIVFHLGRRAKGFIEKKFIAEKSDI